MVIKKLIASCYAGLLGLYSFFWAPVQHPILEIYSFAEGVAFHDIQPDTLVIFDVDQTLIQPVDTYPANENSPEAEQFRNALVQRYPKTDWVKLASIMLKQAERPLVESRIIEQIKQLQARGVNIIACTSMNTGAYGVIPLMEEWRYNHLKSLGFEGSFADTVLPLNINGKKPVLYKGIFATDTVPKGIALGALFDELDYQPKKIVFFDDSLEYIVSVSQMCKGRGIEFFGYIYKGARSVLWNENVAATQAQILMVGQQWVPDQVILFGTRMIENLFEGKRND